MPLAARFTGSNLAKGDRCLNGDKNPQHGFLLREREAIGPMSKIQWHVKELYMYEDIFHWLSLAKFTVKFRQVLLLYYQNTYGDA
jgi:hypothetical protein